MNAYKHGKLKFIILIILYSSWKFFVVKVAVVKNIKHRWIFNLRRISLSINCSIYKWNIYHPFGVPLFWPKRIRIKKINPNVNSVVAVFLTLWCSPQCLVKYRQVMLNRETGVGCCGINQPLWCALLKKIIVTPRIEVSSWRLFIFSLLVRSKGRLLTGFMVFLCTVSTILFNVYFGKFVITFFDIGEIGCTSIPKCHGVVFVAHLVKQTWFFGKASFHLVLSNEYIYICI